MRAALSASIAMNLLLATSIVLARVDATRAAERRPGAIMASTPVTAGISNVAAVADAAAADTGEAGAANALRDPVSLADYYANLRAAGFGHSATMLPLAGWVYRALAAAGPLHEEYWQSSFNAESRRVALEALSAALRSNLESLYGTGVAERPEFRGLFRPLGPRFDFLTSAQQITLAEGLPAARGFMQGPPAAGRPGCGPLPAVPAERARSPQHLPDDVLDAAMRFELALRVSPLAPPLRELGLDEPAFRSAFAAFEATFTASSPEQQLEARRRLQSLLGERAARSIMRSFDPVYTAIADVLGAANVAGPIVDDAYLLVAAARESLLALLLEESPVDIAARVTALRLGERERLAGLVGAAVADRVLDAVSRSPTAPDATGC